MFHNGMYVPSLGVASHLTAVALTEENLDQKCLGTRLGAYRYFISVDQLCQVGWLDVKWCTKGGNILLHW